MIIGIYKSDMGVICGKVKLLDFILCYISTKRDDELHRRFITLYPIENYPFYKNYDRLNVICEWVAFKLIP